MSKRAVKYALIDAFTDVAFKGNPAAVCFLEDDADVDTKWMQAVAREFNVSNIGFISRTISAVGSDSNGQDGAAIGAEIDAFTNEAYKGNPGVVCYLEENADVDPQWMQNVAREFNVSETAFVSRPISAVGSDANGRIGVSRFNLRWFTPVAEVRLCGHCTLAAAHFLLTSGIVKDDIIEFVTKSGILISKKIPKSRILNSENHLSGELDGFCIELDFPAVPVTDIDAREFPSIPQTLNGASIVNVLKTTTDGDLVIEVSSGDSVSNLKPNYKELEKCAGRGVIITGPAPEESGFDFFTRFFCPKLGVGEDPVCGSVHCALVPYWSKKLSKKIFNVFMPSPRSGVLYLQYIEKSERVLIRGEAVTVMLGTIIA